MPGNPSSLQLDSDTMCFFLDESGVPSLPKKQDGFCIGGCAVHSTQLPLLTEKWRELMQKMFNDPMHVFHASADRTKNLHKEDHKEFFNFCNRNVFARFGVGYHKKSDLSQWPKNPYEICARLLIEPCFLKLLENYPIYKPSLSSWVRHPTHDIHLQAKILPFRRVVIIIEDCERDRDIIKKSYTAFGPIYKLNGIDINPEFYLMPKGSIGLQIADLVTNVSYREILRHCKKEKKEQGYDFKEIFHCSSVPEEIKYFFCIEQTSKMVGCSL